MVKWFERNSLTDGIGYPVIVTNGKSILDLSEVESKLNLSVTRRNTFSQFVEILVFNFHILLGGYSVSGSGDDCKSFGFLPRGVRLTHLPQIK